MRTLLLFDIDGTLMWGGKAAKDAFTEALERIYGRTGPVKGHDFSGKTDPQIVRELLRIAGLADDVIDDGMHRFWDTYVAGLRERIVDHRPWLLPGVQDLLDRLAGATDVALGLVTGNIARGAELKLDSVGLGGRFAVGGFGSDHELRNRLPAVALDRARAHWEVDFAPEATWVIGDTPRDVECGRANGTRTLAVATGSWSREDLNRTGADEILDDFADVERVTEILL